MRENDTPRHTSIFYTRFYLFSVALGLSEVRHIITTSRSTARVDANVQNPYRCEGNQMAHVPRARSIQHGARKTRIARLEFHEPG